MSEALNLSISEHRNGVKWTYHLSLTRKENLSSFLRASYIIDLLKQESIRLGYRLTTVGKTSSRSKNVGSK